MKCVVNAFTNRTFSPVSGCVRTTGCSASGNCAFSARRFSIGIAAPKIASMLWRARRPAICVFTCSGRRSYASAMFAHIVSPPTGGHSTQRSTQPNGGFSRHVASVCQAFS